MCDGALTWGFIGLLHLQSYHPGTDPTSPCSRRQSLCPRSASLTTTSTRQCCECRSHDGAGHDGQGPLAASETVRSMPARHPKPTVEFSPINLLVYSHQLLPGIYTYICCIFTCRCGVITPVDVVCSHLRFGVFTPVDMVCAHL